MSEQIEIKTAPADPRFGFTNQTRHCWYDFVQYQKCVKKHGGDDDHAACAEFRKTVRSLCPKDWIAKWKEDVEKGVFPYDFEKGAKKGH